MCTGLVHREHIPNAVFFDLFKGANNTDILPRNVPEATSFEANAHQAGVSADSHVVVYDGEGKCGYFLGSRAWWTFQVCLVAEWNIGRSLWLSVEFISLPLIEKCLHMPLGLRCIFCPKNIHFLNRKSNFVVVFCIFEIPK